MIEITERRLTGNDGTCRTDDRLRDGVHSIDPTSWISWDMPSAI
jgi:hypothetical protein